MSCSNRYRDWQNANSLFKAGRLTFRAGRRRRGISNSLAAWLKSRQLRRQQADTFLRQKLSAASNGVGFRES